MPINDQGAGTKPKALIYCRVSSKKQTQDGSGLASQEQRCREYAAREGFEVERVFTDDQSASGDFLNRRGIRSIIEYLQKHPDQNHAVIFDDLKRFSRDTVFHWKLRETFASYGAIVRCLNFNFEDTPEGKFVETVIAAQGQLEREQIGRQTNQKMRARLKSGFWVFKPAFGYRNERAETGGGRVLVRDEPLATIIERALQGFSSGRFKAPADVKRYLDSQTDFPKNRETGTVRFESVERILRNVIYSGYVYYPKWNVPLLKGKHPALISLSEFQKIQDKLNNKKKGFTRLDENPDFPLRGLVACDECGSTLTAAWSKGKSKKYPYYRCQRPSCSLSTKSIPRARIEEDLHDLLQNLTPTQNTLEIAAAMMGDVIEAQQTELRQAAKAANRRLKELKDQKEALIDRISNATNPTLIEAYERRLLEMESQVPNLTEKAAILTTGTAKKAEDIELALRILSRPCKIYKKGTPEVQRLVAKLAFEEPVKYSTKNGYRTPKLSIPFKVLADFCAQNGKMVPPHGLEPRTY